MHWTEITERAIEDAVVLDVRGQLTLGEQESLLFNHVSRLMAGGRRRIVLNLWHVSYIDSVGIGEIVRSYLHMTRQGGSLGVCGVGPRVAELLHATQLDRVLPIFDSEGEAVR